jgi:hypothetical protein
MTSSSSTLPAASMNRQAPAQAGNARRCRRHRWPLRPARGDACSALCQQAGCPGSAPGTPSQWHGWCGVIGSRRMRRLPSPSVHWNAGTQGSCMFVSTFHVSAKELAIQTVLAPMQLGPQRRQQAVMSWSSRLGRLWHLCWNWAGADSSTRQNIEALQHPGAGAGTGSKRCRWRRHFHETCTLTPTAQERGERECKNYQHTCAHHIARDAGTALLLTTCHPVAGRLCCTYYHVPHTCVTTRTLMAVKWDCTATPTRHPVVQ